MRIFKPLYLSIILIVFISCEKDDNTTISDTLHGILISNEGAYDNGDGSLSYFNKDSLIVTNDLFFSVNNKNLGDVVQSVSVYDNQAFIVVNNSKKVEVVDLKIFESTGTINGLSYPRYFLPVDDNKGYVTNGSIDGKIYVIDMNALVITDSIVVGYGPENLTTVNGKAYICNSGGWMLDSTISVIDIATDKVEKTINVAHCPTDIVVDMDNNIWVLCKGYVVMDFTTFEIISETESKLVKISTVDYSVLKEVVIGKGNYYNTLRLAINGAGDKIYFTLPDGIYTYDVSSESSDYELLVSNVYYGLEVDPEDETVYGFKSPSYTSSGYMLRYKPSGELIDSFKVGIGPNGAVFY